MDLSDVLIEVHDAIMTSFVTPSQRLFGVIGVPAPGPVRLAPTQRAAAETAEEIAEETTVAERAQLQVRAIAWTQFESPEAVPWQTDADGGDALVEFAGRACYESWSKPNPATATNPTYLRHLLEVGHLATFEHATATVYIAGLSQSAAHELVRHRHLSFSQLSPRQAQDGALHIVEPDVIADDPQLHERFVAVADAGARAHAELLADLEQALAGSPDATLRRKQARQAARSVLPVATETRLVVTGNYRAWRHFIAVRASEHADVEVRAVAIACLRELTRIAPNSFADFEVTRLGDGTPIASSPLAAEG
jgi:thymidylate synthase (FAD)